MHMLIFVPGLAEGPVLVENELRFYIFNEVYQSLHSLCLRSQICKNIDWNMGIIWFNYFIGLFN